MLTVLYVEDNIQNMGLMRRIFSQLPYTLLEAPDPKTALEILYTEQIDLMLMDINLPGTDGLSLTRLIRENSSYQDLPIIAVTANAMHGDRDKCLEAGCNAYLAKPVARVELVNMLQRVATMTQAQ